MRHYPLKSIKNHELIEELRGESMPPHCDTIDGPVVKAAKTALKKGNVNLILPWAPKTAEVEIKKAFQKTLRARKVGKAAAQVADYWFYETVVRLHREGEGAPYTGLKQAIETGDPKEVVRFLTRTVEHELHRKFKHAIERKDYAVDDVVAARAFVQANLGFVLYSHHLYAYIKGEGGHGEEGKAGHEH